MLPFTTAGRSNAIALNSARGYRVSSFANHPIDALDFMGFDPTFLIINLMICRGTKIAS
jgi:hypothetical protein